MKRLNKQLTSESGRSMVEILGVLAVIGAFSLAGRENGAYWYG